MRKKQRGGPSRPKMVVMGRRRGRSPAPRLRRGAKPSLLTQPTRKTAKMTQNKGGNCGAENREDILSPSNNKLTEVLEEANKLFKDVRQVREAALDAQFLVVATDLGKEKATQMLASNDFDPSVFAEHLLSFMGLNRLEDEEEEEQNGLAVDGYLPQDAWHRLARKAQSCFSTAPSFHYMNGAFHVEPPPPKPRIERQSKASAKQVKRIMPTQLKKLEGSHQEATEKEVERILGYLRTYHRDDPASPISYYEFVIDPNSFSRTVENIFHTSFLIRNLSRRSLWRWASRPAGNSASSPSPQRCGRGGHGIQDGELHGNLTPAGKSRGPSAEPNVGPNLSVKAEVHAEGLTRSTDASSSQQSLPSSPVLPDIPVVTGVEENEAAGDQDDKEELEFPHDLLPSLDFSSELNIWGSSLGLEAAEEGGEEDMKHKGGLASEHIISSQPEGSVGGVSSAETETCPPTDVAESLLKPQYWSEQNPSITESPCVETDHSSQCWQQQQNAADLPPSTPSEQSSSNTNGAVGAGGKLSGILEEAPPSMDGVCEGLPIAQEEKTQILVSPQPQPPSQGTSVEQESNGIQQVRPDWGTFEARTAEDSSEIQVQVNKDSSCNAPVDQKPVTAETEDVSQNRPAGVRAQEQSTVWTEPLKEPAAHFLSKQQNTMVVSSPLSSLESPQLDFHTPTEEVDVSPKQEEIPPQHKAVEKISDLLQPLKPTEELPEPPQPNQSTNKLQTERNESGLTGWIKTSYLPAEEQSEEQHTIASSNVVEDAPELKPLSDREKNLEALAHEKQEPPKTIELFDLEKTVIIELPEEKVVDTTAEESFKVLPEETTGTEAYQDPSQVLPSSRLSHADCPQPPTSEHHLLAALPHHSHDTDSLPTPPETPKADALPVPPSSPPALASSPVPTADPSVDHASVPCHLPLRYEFHAAFPRVT
ncbi:unnamed protein product [Tetraodon nigroviridis]|uniref:(spotted green pufferfish) hypothetical protein n=1 Tax=Tetraodon nigroviridis TaxID=99883 RepID=Q4RQ34_TETNG|nr:unnamed protein product [Tetraodon nigroviridis]